MPGLEGVAIDSGGVVGGDGIAKGLFCTKFDCRGAVRVPGCSFAAMTLRVGSFAGSYTAADAIRF